MRKVLVTGGCGFVGSHIIERIIHETDWNVISLDRLTYAGNLKRLAHLPAYRLKIIHHDFREPLGDELLKDLDGVEYIVHNGAETHVKRSFANPDIFMQSNVTGTFNVLEAARKLQPNKFLYTSTDEVFGPAMHGQLFIETDPLVPSNPYSASKAAGEMLVRSYWKSFELPAIITRTENMFGEWQNPEKFVPMTVKNLLYGYKVLIHMSPKAEVGSRQWLHAGVQASAILFLLGKGVPGEVYNIAGTSHSNLKIAKIIADILDVGLTPYYVNAYVEFPAHDLHYGIDGRKIREMGWKPPLEFADSFSRTVLWMKDNTDWLQG